MYKLILSLVILVKKYIFYLFELGVKPFNFISLIQDTLFLTFEFRTSGLFLDPKWTASLILKPYPTNLGQKLFFELQELFLGLE